MKKLRDCTILLVDDTEMNIDVLLETLGDDYDDIAVAMSGPEALEMVAEEPPDLILLDVMMPEMDGYEVCKILKSQDSTQKIPIIFVTAKSQVEDEIKGFNLGAADYIAKPISPPKVKSRVKNQLELKIAKEFLENQNIILEEKVSERTQSLSITQNKLEKLVKYGISLSAERNTEKILTTILNGGKDLSHADAATLYLRTEDDHLRFAVRTRTDKLPFTTIPMYDPETKTPNHHNISTHVALTGETINIPDAYLSDAFDFSGTKKFDQATGYRSQSFLTVPLKPRGGKVIGVLQLINAIDPKSGDIIAFDEELVGFIEALAAQAAVAIDNQRLLEMQKALFNSFIKLIASAIDAKSPYTGGHCERVPELAQMLAQAAHESSEDPFIDFNLTEDASYEMHLASWLHDCGKVTTPEYVVDKATKLETIHNRIHEIRMRFEVLRRDAEIAYLKALMENPADSEGTRVIFEKKLLQLQEDFAFVAECNVGGEFMAPEKKERILKIAQQKWYRHYDDCLGLSIAELNRKASCEGVTLPVLENLLSDKDEHIIHRTNQNYEAVLKEMGIDMDIPKHLYNKGEIYNLCIDRGTLTKEERFKVNDHVIQSITMLEKLPFADSTQNVPKIAGAHHETMIGTGYPRKLTRAQMSIHSRVLAIADIFEALTASDRPYKKAKTLNAALKIMSFMKKDKHIDADLFDLFLKNKVYLKYAEKFLLPDQIDNVDIDSYLN